MNACMHTAVYVRVCVCVVSCRVGWGAVCKGFVCACVCVYLWANRMCGCAFNVCVCVCAY